METLTTLYVASLTISAVLSAVLGVVTFRNRSEPAMQWFTAVLASLVLWSGGQILDTLATTFWQAGLGNNVKYLGVLGTATFFFLFALEYTDNGEYVTPRGLALLAAYPVGIGLAIWTNPLHGLVWATTSFDPGGISAFENAGTGMVFWVHAAIGYALFVTSSVLLGRLYYRSQSLYRGQIAATLVAVFVPLVANVLYVVGLIPYDLTPTAFLVTGLAVLSAVRWFEFSELTPIARNTVVDTMQAGVFVVDADGRVRDVNPAGRRTIDQASRSDDGAAADGNGGRTIDGSGASDGNDDTGDGNGGTGDGDGAGPGTLVGRQAQDVFESMPGLYECYTDLDDGVTEVTVDTGDRLKRYRVEVTPISDGRTDDRGRLVVVHDITDRYERERELERQNEQLEQFASLVSHDLRNPLSVADGYVEMIDDQIDDPETEEYVAEVARSHVRMRRIIDDVLTMARQGQTIDETQPVALGDLANRAWSNVDTDDATLDNRLSGVVEGDPDRLLNVFENLFRNSIDHGTGGESDGGHGSDTVTVRVGPTSRATAGDGTSHVGAGFFVEDDGPGIPEDRRETVFEAGHTTHAEGTGLGLSIVEQVIEAHGWEVRATESADGGARFEVTGIPGIQLSSDAEAQCASD